MKEKRQDVQKPHPRRAAVQPTEGHTEPAYEQFHKDRLIQGLVAMVIITAIFYAVWM